MTEIVSRLLMSIFAVQFQFLHKYICLCFAWQYFRILTLFWVMSLNWFFIHSFNIFFKQFFGNEKRKEINWIFENQKYHGRSKLFFGWIFILKKQLCFWLWDEEGYTYFLLPDIQFFKRQWKSWIYKWRYYWKTWFSMKDSWLALTLYDFL